MVHPRTCAQCCGIFSVCGVAYLTIIGLLIETQPLYVRGLEATTTSGTNCFFAAAMYTLFAIISFVYLRLTSTRNRYEESEERIEFNKPASYERMKVGVRYGAIDIHEKF